VDTPVKSAAGKLRVILRGAESNNDEDFLNITSAKEEVLARFQPVFTFDNIPYLEEDEFRAFLLLKNNKHWSGLHRRSNAMCDDMDKLKAALSILLDENRPIAERLDELIPKNNGPMIQGLGRATVTAILQVALPDKYGVWNNTSEFGMKNLNVWPEFNYGAAFGERYESVNERLLLLSDMMQIDLWTLDALWWRVRSPDEDMDDEDVLGVEDEELPRFGLEKYLQGFLRDNWNQIPELSGDWELYEEDGEIVGYEYDTSEIGRIDLLAYHKEESRWLVIELKKDQTSDQTIGQVLRYMGWVSKKLAADGEQVQGMIICHSADKRIEYALMHTQNVEVMFYRVEFHLGKSSSIEAS